MNTNPHLITEVIYVAKVPTKDKRREVRHYLILKDVDPIMAEYISEGLEHDALTLAHDYVKRNPIPEMEPAANVRIETTIKGTKNN
jgi:hypothetical protein